MANKNKNTNELVDLSDEDATSELEIPTVLREAGIAAADRIEIDENTYEISHVDSRFVGKSKLELKSALQEQSIRVETLEFEFEQAENRRRSLEEELSAYKEIAETFSAQALQSERARMEADTQLNQALEHSADLQRSLDDAGAEIEKANAATNEARAKANDAIARSKEQKRDADETRKQIKLLEKKLSRRDKSLANLRARIRKAREQKGPLVESARIAKLQLAELDTELRASRTEVATLSQYIDARREEWEPLNEQLARLTSQLDAEKQANRSLREDLAARTAEVAHIRNKLDTTTESLRQHETDLEAFRSRNTELEKLNADAQAEAGSNRAVLAEQRGRLATDALNLAELEKDNKRLEQYADALRRRLQDQLSIAEDTIAVRQALETRLQQATHKIVDLKERVSSEVDRADSLHARNEQLAKDFEQEARQIRFELSSAQETLTDQEVLAEQLASDLVEHRSFRQALEAQLGEIEAQSDVRIRRLTKQLKRAQTDVDELNRKIKMKDRTIGDLMRELAGQDKVEKQPESDADSGLQPIDGFRADEQVQRAPAEKDRVARLLIGKADGRELRFPLFKDRLTIGRTSHNDIQLNMQYVSRRHAVLSTDDGKTRVIDWGSRNGVYVNGKRVTEKILGSGDVVTIGTTDFRYEERGKH